MTVRLGPVATGNRNVELGVAPHAVLRDVQTGRLGLGSTRMPHRRFIAQSDPNEAEKVNSRL